MQSRFNRQHWLLFMKRTRLK